MKLEKAIEHLDDCMSETEKILFPEVLEAHNLGIEGLELIKRMRKNSGKSSFAILPGETEE